MAFINKHNTNGTKGLLSKGELGYDDYAAGGDTGRVYVGTGVENIALAERLEANTMTKAQFNALAEERKANRAGSGFDEFGKHAVSTNYYPTINEGMFVSILNHIIYNGNIKLGYAGADNTGVSKTNYPIANVNGIRHRVDNGTASNNITLPTAPNIYPHDTVLTPEQIASGVIKHADASNSGLIVNGKFDTDTSGWNNNNNTVSLSSVDGKLQVRFVANLWAYQTISTVVGKKYKVSFSYKASGGGVYAYFRIGTYIADQSLYGINTQSTISTTYEIEFTATTTATFIHCGASNTAGQYAEFDNIAVYPVDAISRSDLVFLESWHEDISEKNIVYPLGNVQYLGGNADGLPGIANGAFTGFEQYSLFGNWQTPSSLIGKGYVWSSLTEAQKKAFIANPENNCYLDGDKTIQVRYRVRVVQGLGDSWDYPFYNMIDGRGSNPVGSTVSYSIPSNLYIKPKGKRASIRYDLTRYEASETGFFANKNYTNITTGYEIGMATAVNQAASALDTNVAHEGKCFAIPLALVHR